MHSSTEGNRVVPFQYSMQCGDPLLKILLPVCCLYTPSESTDGPESIQVDCSGVEKLFSM